MPLISHYRKLYPQKIIQRIAKENLKNQLFMGLLDKINDLLRLTADEHSQLEQQQTTMEATIDRLRIETATANKANDSKDKFLARLSHEIRTPINGILGMTQVLLDEDLEDKQKYLVQVAQDSTNNLLLTINDLLDYSKLQAGKLILSVMIMILLNY